MGVFGVPAGLTGSSGNILILLVILMVGLVVGGMIGILVCELFGFASEHPISGEKEYPNFFVGLCTIGGVPLVFYIAALLFGNQ